MTYAGDDGVIRTQMDAGVAKMRPRFTAVPEDLNCSIEVDAAGLQVLDEFYTITLKRVLAFAWRDFRKPNDLDTAAVYRFKSKPKHSPTDQTGKRWRVDMELELLTTFQGTFLLDVGPLTT